MKLIDHNFRRSIAKGVSPLPVGVCSIDATAASRDVFLRHFFTYVQPKVQVFLNVTGMISIALFPV